MIEGSEGLTVKEEPEYSLNSSVTETTRAPTSEEALAIRRLERLQSLAQIPLPFSDEQVQIFESLPPFLKKLYKILAKGAYAFWNAEGTSFYIARPHEFAIHVLPNFFNHSNLNSFIRQLNVYGFHKIKLPDKHTELLCYQHPHFLINDFDDMLKIKRNGAIPSKRTKPKFGEEDQIQEQEESKTPDHPFHFPTKRPRTQFLPYNFAPHYRLLPEETQTLDFPVAKVEEFCNTPDAPATFEFPRKRQPSEEPKRRQNKRGRNKHAKDTEQLIDELSQQLQRVENERDSLKMELDVQKQESEKWRARAMESEATLNSFVKNIAQNFHISPTNIEAKFVEEDADDEEGERIGGDSLINFRGLRGRAYHQDVTDSQKKHFKIKIVILDEMEEQGQLQYLQPLTAQEEVSPEIEFISSSHSEAENYQNPVLVNETSFRFNESPGPDEKEEIIEPFYTENSYYGGGQLYEGYEGPRYVEPMGDIVTRDCSYLENGGVMLGMRSQPWQEWGE